MTNVVVSNYAGNNSLLSTQESNKYPTHLCQDTKNSKTFHRTISSHSDAYVTPNRTISIVQLCDDERSDQDLCLIVTRASGKYQVFPATDEGFTELLDLFEFCVPLDVNSAIPERDEDGDIGMDAECRATVPMACLTDQVHSIQSGYLAETLGTTSFTPISNLKLVIPPDTARAQIELQLTAMLLLEANATFWACQSGQTEYADYAKYVGLCQRDVGQLSEDVSLGGELSRGTKRRAVSFSSIQAKRLHS